MRIWARELESYTHDYVRRGGKQNRRKQVSLIINFLEFTDAQEGLTSLHRLGKRHVINFWKAHRDMPEKSAYDYWLGLCQLWSWLGKSEKPPRPHNHSSVIACSVMVSSEQQNDDLKTFGSLSETIKAAREARGMPIQKLANMTGCEVAVIGAIESGHYSDSFLEVQNLLEALGIRFQI
ncbi:helix-turn-helix transcriptional regulator [Methylobacter sp. BBA5.1]|uniref:helix-turn-helix domain-containing protein n=1 Tax=Methylobacter sp. BBA5.1 TaxID=1495064 RepID=UPI00056D6291|nr:helix-turn-helix transcriptional regulator [Methylobacter sp. BBA5.1]